MTATSLRKTTVEVQNFDLSIRQYPQVIKYMGSKAKIIDFVIEGIRDVHNVGTICDLFSGAGSLAGALGNETNFISNDIQKYSATISRCYLGRISDHFYQMDIREIISRAIIHFNSIWAALPENLTYGEVHGLEDFNKLEKRNQDLIKIKDWEPYTLFTQCYSGTWWSAEQCAWIDALRKSADDLKKEAPLTENDFSVFLTALMHAMAYSSQGTGHFAQYRDAKSISSMKDISIYRNKSLVDLFENKFQSLREWNYKFVSSHNNFKVTARDYEDCLSELSGGTVYADPPYAFVHYSRFYHALETLVLYDYPDIQIKGGKTVKGRYREGRHQSPFSIKTQVPKAFAKLFLGTKAAKSNLVLSYSDSGLFELDQLLCLASDLLGSSYELTTRFLDHKHMTMGRSKDRDRDVIEALVLAKYQPK